jgi:hypothetical protein
MRRTHGSLPCWPRGVHWLEQPRECGFRLATGYRQLGMCDFLTVGIDAKRGPSLEAALRGARLEVSRSINPHVAQLFPATDALFLVTRGGCSCGLWVTRDANPTEESSKLETKLRRKGYSETKLARALATAKADAEMRALQRTVSPVLGILGANAPVHVYRHAVSGDPLTEAVPEGAKAGTYS